MIQSYLFCPNQNRINTLLARSFLICCLLSSTFNLALATEHFFNEPASTISNLEDESTNLTVNACTEKVLVAYDLGPCNAYTPGTFATYPQSGDCSEVTATRITSEGMTCRPSGAVWVEGNIYSGYLPNHDKAVRFSVTIDPLTDGQLTELRFRASATATSYWGTFLKVGLRVLKDGREVFRKTEIPTRGPYGNGFPVERTIDLSGDADLKVTQRTTFDFELLAYEPSYAPTTVARLLDLYSLELIGCCSSNSCANPQPIGRACNDNNPNTQNDVIQADGCTCQGETVANAACNPTQVAYWNFNDCASNQTNGGTNYSEFDGITNNGSCGNVSISNIFRKNNTVNPHSCTPGRNASTAICVSSLTDCSYDANNSKALRFDVTLDPGANQSATLTGIEFFEQAPTRYVWIGGTSGTNNYPTRYGIRVTRNGQEVFRQVDIATQRNWNLETFNFANDPDFTVTTNTTFSFELLGYCIIDNNEEVTAWDIEDLRAFACCFTPDPCANQGGDSDNDGVCNNQDCQPNNPNIPAPAGSACNDGNPNTQNDRIQADGCTCVGTVVDPCANQGGDSDNDGVCDNQDCQPNNPNFPATAGTACDDGNPNTTNDVIKADGCSCAGTPAGGGNPDCDTDISITTGAGKITVTGLDAAPISSLQVFNSSWNKEFSCFADCPASKMLDVSAGTYYIYVKYYTAGYQLICEREATVTVTGGGGGNDPCANQGGDSDNDGICNNQDCQPNNPNFPAPVGSACNDGNANTNNDQIQSDGCTCAGTPTGGGGGGNSDCDTDISITTSAGKITVTGLDAAPISSLQVFNSSWNKEFSCFADCPASKMLDVSAGTYYIYVKYYTAGYQLTCEREETVTVTDGGGGNNPCANQGGDSDNDGVCNNQDCQPNNPNFPTTPGTACNDGDSNTQNDVVQSDGCSCRGTVVDPCTNQGGDSDNDGICNNQDCQPNNPNFPATPGTACNDGNANTQNDVVQSDGCSCRGTVVDPCANQGGDSDNDGICDNLDCQPNNPNRPATPGTSCNDGNPNTRNDVILGDGCTCQGTPVNTCQEEQLVFYNLDVCEVDNQAGQFPPITTPNSCTNISASNLGYSTFDNRTVHSCVSRSGQRGAENSFDAICWGASPSNNFNPVGGSLANSPHYFFFTFDASSASGGRLSSLSFFMKGTTVSQRQSITRAGVRILRNGVTVFQQANFPVSRTQWTPITVDLSSDPDLVLGGNARYEVRIQGYGTDNNGRFDPLMEIDQIRLRGCCGSIGNDPCANAGGDSDNDGICNNQDCAPNDPNFPKPAGTTCDDNNANTMNDVIQSDGCTCAGTPTGGGNGNGGGGNSNNTSCDNVTFSGNNGQITIGNLGAPITIVKVFNSSWQEQSGTGCTENCNSVETYNVPNGTYQVSVKFFSAAWQPICEETRSVTVTGSSGGGNNGGSNITLTCPNNITVTQNQTGGRIVSWNAPTAMTSCNGGTQITQTSGNANGTLFPTGTTTVRYRITDNCGSTQTCSFTVTVTTSSGGNNGGGVPSGYCAAKGTNPWTQWIKNVRIGSINNSSGKEGYRNFSTESTDFTPGQSISLTLTPGYSYTRFNMKWRVWIDWNRDGDFDDTNELVFEKAGQNAVSGSFYVPNNASAGATKIRVAAEQGNYPAACGTFVNGEVEDYVGNITGNGIAPLAADNSTNIQLYPNPAQAQAFLDLTSIADEAADVLIIDQTGRTVQLRHFDYAPAGATTLELADLPAGIYFVKVQTAERQFIQRLLIQ